MRKPRTEVHHIAERVPLTRDRIVTAAVALADDGGLDRVSMRRLAAAIGYEPMSLYNHIDGKDDLLAGMVDAVVAEMQLPSTACAWREGVHAAMASSRAVLRAHPWAPALWNSTWPGPARRRWMDGLLGSLRGAGCSVELAHHGFHMLDLYVQGHVTQQLTFAMPEDLGAAAAAFLDETPEHDFPHLVEHVRHHVEAGDTEDDDFDFMLDLLLDGLERHLDDGGR